MHPGQRLLDPFEGSARRQIRASQKMCEDMYQKSDHVVIMPMPGGANEVPLSMPARGQRGGDIMTGWLPRAPLATSFSSAAGPSWVSQSACRFRGPSS